VNEEPNTDGPRQPELRLAHQAALARDRILEALDDLLERALKLATRGAIVISGPFSPYTADRVREMITSGFDDARSMLQQLWDDHLEPWMGRPGNSARIEEVADAWGETVAGQLDGISGWLTKNKMAIDNRWTGLAAKAYVDTLPAQKEAVTAVREKAESVSFGLKNLASALGAFWANVVLEFGNAAIEIAGITLGWFVVNTGERAGEIIRELVRTVRGLVENFGKARDTYIAAVNSLAVSLRQNDAFPKDLHSGGASWPTPGYGVPTKPSAWIPREVG
jgi:hypothetical protein